MFAVNCKIVAVARASCIVCTHTTLHAYAAAAFEQYNMLSVHRLMAITPPNATCREIKVAHINSTSIP